jgi:prepilin-type processing-associated H-X9-DG protein
VRMLPFFEQSAMYNATNFNLESADIANVTIAGVQINSLICPSDTQNQAIGFPSQRASSSGVIPGWSFNENPTTYSNIVGLPQQFTSYAGNAGTFTFGYSNLMSPTILGFFNGVIYNDGTVRIAAITDGTSNTFIFGEHSKGHLYTLDPGYAVSDNSWNSGRWYDSLFATLYPLNLAAGNGAAIANSGYSYYYPTDAGSYHPGGANFAMCDGSVRFIKNSIASWTFFTGNADSYGDAMPDGTVFTVVPATAPAIKSGEYLANGTAQLGVYQALSTRAGGEVISSDQY